MHDDEDDWQKRMQARLKALEEDCARHRCEGGFVSAILRGYVAGIAISVLLMLLAAAVFLLWLLLAVLESWGVEWAGHVLRAIENWLP